MSTNNLVINRSINISGYWCIRDIQNRSLVELKINSCLLPCAIGEDRQQKSKKPSEMYGKVVWVAGRSDHEFANYYCPIFNFIPIYAWIITAGIVFAIGISVIGAGHLLEILLIICGIAIGLVPSAGISACLNRGFEYVGVQPVVIPELEFGDI